MKKNLQVLALVIGIMSLIIVGFVDLRLSLGLILFGWAMNLDNTSKSYKL